MAEGGGNASEDETVGGALILGIFVVAAWVIWYFYQDVIMDGIRWMRVWELRFLGLFVENYSAWADDLAAIPRANLDMGLIMQASDLVMRYLKWPIFGALLFAAGWAAFFSKPARFKTVHSMQTLITAQAKAWPYISPLIKFHPAETSSRSMGDMIPAALAPMAEALTPEEWIAHNGITIHDGEIDMETAAAAFARQLGRRWRGFEKLPFFAQGLAAAFCLLGNQQRKQSEDILQMLAQNYDIGQGLKITFKLEKAVKATFANRKVMEEAEKLARGHAFEITVLLRLLHWARKEGGVLAPAEFVWLKAERRSMWYPLNNLGRQTFHSEASGVMSHFITEMNVGRPLIRPQVDIALAALKEYVEERNPSIPPAEDAVVTTRSIPG